MSSGLDHLLDLEKQFVQNYENTISNMPIVANCIEQAVYKLDKCVVCDTRPMMTYKACKQCYIYYLKEAVKLIREGEKNDYH
jgi:hypothetical protein